MPAGSKTRRFSRFRNRIDIQVHPHPYSTQTSYIEPTALKIFVGTWNTECIPVSWEAFLSRPKQPVSRPSKQKRGPQPSSSIKTSAGVPIKSTLKSQVLQGSSFRDSELRELMRPETLCYSSSSDSDVTARSQSTESHANSLNETVRSHSFGLTDVSLASERFRRSSSARNPVTRYQGVQRTGHPVHEVDPNSALKDWIKPGYDVYLINLQECSAPAQFFEIITAFCSQINELEYKNVELDAYKISGYGDGATFFPKSTAIGCICRAEYIDRAWATLDSHSCSFHKLNASKGAVFMTAEALQQRILFIGCHLTPASPEARLHSRLEIRRRICEWLNIQSFDDYFDHVIWSGDFNFRLREVNCKMAIRCLEKHAIRALFQYDEIYDSVWSEDLADDRFVEAEVTFFPTYKKVKGRDPVCRNTPGWVSEEYAVRYKSQWYKGGRTKDRVPGWTDRIIKWTSQIATKPLLFIQGTYMASDGLDADNPIFASDHSPVGVGLVLGALS
eukprot:Protomagalhaensia_sp_Gyna_25__1325@NODE_1666_length_1646_cov_6_346609_g1364_i0_p1_GENE_NODE_1666_length_1646_cov_6_346609_g1364_i0NODE_1666_length_1646_cov_6_346609_g1364_i0_p1_ORF_typecomplete_len518_score59_67Exo_endo_phos/PF03372_23/0_0038_NODE_1666_length_1646_cov_6_346609_g1364_i0921600